LSLKDNLTEYLKNIELKALETAKKMEKPNPCEKYVVEDYDRYVKHVRGNEPFENVEVFEKHCEVCTSCRHGIAQSNDKYIDETLLKKTMEFYDSLKPESNIIEIILSVSKNLLKVMRTTGTILSSPLLEPTRGKIDESEPRQSFKIVQEFVQPPISVQIFLEGERSRENIKLNISLFDKQAEEFMSETPISLAGPNESQEKTTDKNGQAAFLIQGQGNYRATILSEAVVAAQVNLSIT